MMGAKLGHLSSHTRDLQGAAQEAEGRLDRWDRLTAAHLSQAPPLLPSQPPCPEGCRRGHRCATTQECQLSASPYPHTTRPPMQTPLLMGDRVPHK